MIIEKRTNISDFEILKTIGRGAFGKVQLVAKKLNFFFLFFFSLVDIVIFIYCLLEGTTQREQSGLCNEDA
jgi:hypothetical protein